MFVELSVNDAPSIFYLLSYSSDQGKLHVHEEKTKVHEYSVDCCVGDFDGKYKELCGVSHIVRRRCILIFGG